MLDKVVVRRNKFELASEQNFERLWREAQEAGWSFPRFCEHVACMLVVFERRDRKGEGLAELWREAQEAGWPFRKFCERVAEQARGRELEGRDNKKGAPL